MKIRGKFGAEESGSELVEFALASVLLFTLIFGIIDCTHALYADHFVSYAAREATRYAMVRGSTWNGTACASTTTVECVAGDSDVSAYIQSIVPPWITANSVTVNSTWPGITAAGASCGSSTGTDPGCVVEVTVTYPFSFSLPFLPRSAMTFSSSSAATITQ